MTSMATGEQKRYETNLEFKLGRYEHPEWDAESKARSILEESKDIDAVTVCFSDIEGRLHMLDYDKNFLLRSADNLTFDGSSIRGFTVQHESDLKIFLHWAAMYFLPISSFGRKVFIFGEIRDKDGSSYSSDIRSMLRKELIALYKKQIRVHAAAEIEGFIFKGINAEQNYINSFEYITSGGYFNTLPKSPLREFIDQAATIQRNAGFANEKDHPEVAPSQFEINWSYTDALIAADQTQLYKMICRQIAFERGQTACFLPKPIAGVNGNGMHTNISFMNLEDNKNTFFGTEDHNLSQDAWDFVNSVLNHGEEICLALNPSVNAYRRLDPAYEAPNEIKASAVDRGSMIRVPIGNEKSARIEVRTVAPDANPYLVILTILKAGLAGKNKPREIAAMLPSDIYMAMPPFRDSILMKNILGPDVHTKYMKWKEEAADRCPRKLGSKIKQGEVLFHHEVTNQNIWSSF